MMKQDLSCIKEENEDEIGSSKMTVDEEGKEGEVDGSYCVPLKQSESEEDMGLHLRDKFSQEEDINGQMRDLSKSEDIPETKF
mmetsp:Transcript_31536/g.27925  ORF Transcript_31536/g.27925 Transcript_31536/m.27925 type:complete len:83 (+) Transcript_31536:341-589(+)